MNHTVRFFRDVNTDLHKAVCTCGWFTLGSADYVHKKAATHDFEWEAVEPQAAVQR